MTVFFALLVTCASETAPSYGHGLLNHWQMAKGYTNLNHGSYGATPIAVTLGLRKHYDEQELRPDYWFRYNGNNRTLFGSLDQARTRIAKLINAKHSGDVVFVDNASGGMNAVLRSVILEPQDKILYLNLAYGMVKTTINYVYEHDEREAPLQANITVPSSNAAIVAAVEAALKASPSIKIASFSHITSIPAVILPVKQLTAACRKRGVLVLIDGAHALGSIPIDVQDIDADFYVANGHKWLFSPKGSAIVWARPASQDLVHPNIISYEGQGKTPFQLEFSYTGTKDYSPFLAMADALDFRESVLGGEEAIMKYNHDLAVRGGDLLSSKWQTDKLTDDAYIGAMANVRLPAAAVKCCEADPSHPGVGPLAAKLFEKYDTWVPFYLWGGHCYTRVSAQVYNELSDFEMLADAVLELLKSC
jgi:selenocysteine lyase/cysteine desulfurase